MLCPTNDEICFSLDKLFLNDPKGYAERIDALKGVGYKILRNSQGKHKIAYNSDYLDDAFGGIFKGAF